MKRLHHPDTMRYHLAGSDFSKTRLQAVGLGAKYMLFTAYGPVQSIVKGREVQPRYLDFIRCEAQDCDHVIQDSGLFTMLFGAGSGGNFTKDDIYKWYDALVQFTLAHGQPITCVEVDAQRFLGSDETHKLRERMKNDLPNNRIMNVFHAEDKMRGLDRLIEFSDYIALSSNFISSYPEKVRQTIEYIKNKNPEIDIHLLGFSGLEMFSWVNKVCSSCDSTSWLSALRFGRVGSFACKEICLEKARKYTTGFFTPTPQPEVNVSTELFLAYLKSIGLRWY